MLTRRDLLVAAAGALVSACSRRESASRAATPATSASASVSSRSRVLEWNVRGDLRPRSCRRRRPHGSADRLLPAPPCAPRSRRGGEIALGRGARWPRDYALLRAIDRVSASALVIADYEGLADPARIEKTNVDLATHPYGGLVVACPHIPDLSPNGDEIPAVARYLVDVVIPRCRSDTPSCATATGIDGVSMGGALALRVGLSHPETFNAVGALHAAIALEHVEELTELAVAARAKRPALKLRLLTSSGDYFRDAIVALSRSWRAAGVAHDFADVPGPHDYIFNRGPGSIELLTWHDRALRENAAHSR